MTTRPVFVASQVLTASEQNQLATAIIAIRASTSASVTALLADDGKLVTMSNASANTLQFHLIAALLLVSVHK